MKWFKKIHFHKWERVYIAGKINGVNVKVIGTYCLGCRKGYKEVMDLSYKMGKELICATYNEKYFDAVND